MILCREKYAQAIDKAVFPGVQGGPHDNTTAAIAVALKEASTKEFRQYARQIVNNAAALADTLMARGFRLITNGTENHLMLVDLTSKGISGKKAARILDTAGIVLNCNAIPFDPRKPYDPSGIRLGTAAVTSRGFKETEMVEVGRLLDQVISDPENEATHARIAAEVRELCSGFPAPGLEHIV
jgi:glycine hydroxymethyltransferase